MGRRERKRERVGEQKKRKKNNTLKEILSNPTEWAGESERTKRKKNTLKEILSNRVGRRERKRESVCPCFSLKYLRRYYSVKH